MERIRDAVEQARKERQRSDVGDSSRVLTDLHSSKVDELAIEHTDTRLVTVSPSVREQNRLVAAIPGHALQDIYGMLRTRILQGMKANNWNTLGVTSPLSGSGKTLTAINLSITIGRDLSHTALLIDADLRHPSAAGYFGYEPEYGLNDYLFNDVPLSQVLFHPDMDRLTVLPGREAMSESAEMLSSPKLVSLVQDIKSRYIDRMIIMDIAPVLNVDDALALKPTVDCILMVVESGETKQEELAEALELLDGIPIIGTVLNKVDKKVDSAY
jgi:capsular exopolysaccharide synthesis family protein